MAFAEVAVRFVSFLLLLFFNINISTHHNIGLSSGGKLTKFRATLGDLKGASYNVRPSRHDHGFKQVRNIVAESFMSVT